MNKNYYFSAENEAISKITANEESVKCKEVTDIISVPDPFDFDDDDDCDIDDDDFEDDGDVRNEDDSEGESGGKEPSWNLIKAFDYVLGHSRGLKGKVKGVIADSALSYLTTRLEMTQMQVLVIAVLIDEGRAMSWKMLGEFFGLTRISMMTYSDDIENLLHIRRWLIKRGVRERTGRYEGFALVHGVVTAIRHDEVFQPENISGLNIQDFVDRLSCHITDISGDSDSNFKDEEQYLMYFVEQNAHLPLCKAIMGMNGDEDDKVLMLLIVADYARWGEGTQEGLSMRDINHFYDEEYRCHHIRRRLSEGNHELQKKGWLEYKCEDGMADTSRFVLTRKAKEELLEGFMPLGSLKKDKARDSGLVSYKNIVSKELFYNEREQEQIDRLREMLSQEQLPKIQQRLKDQGMRTGVAILLSGGPGTGKTEISKQLARETGRDLLMVDISQVKDMFVGNSEKNTKAIFERYKRLCKSRDALPILFINEADALLGKRLETVSHSVDQMANSMQNIFLQCIEDLEGILICTTNLSQNLDKAFSRRFLIQCEIDKPKADVRTRIWQSMMPTLSTEEAHTLAEHYDFSGGHIENVSRKSTIEYVLHGKRPDLSELEKFCKEENAIQRSTLKPIVGFGI